MVFMLYIQSMKKYKFAFKELMIDLGVKNANQAYTKYFTEVMTRTNVRNMWDRQPKQVSVNTINVICNALDIDPSYLWRIAK